MGQGVALTTVEAGDVALGLEAARRDVETRCDIETAGALLLVTSSAAGGLRMTVHGLTREMTLRAAREASLGAGAIVTLTTAGVMTPDDLDAVRLQRPNLILLAGGVDDGDRRVVVANAAALATLELGVPVIYAGNQAARGAVQRLLEAAGVPAFMVENVYPQLDVLHIEPVRRVIQDVFAQHIVTAPGMAALKERVGAAIMPTPGAVLCATELLADMVGDVMTVDVGGATTDVHSVTEGDAALARLRVAPEPRSKRTVEGDLGVYINAPHVVAAAEVQCDLQGIEPLPVTDAARQKAAALTQWAVDVAVWRHAGDLQVTYGVYGRYEQVEGRDLTAVRTVIGTGGALTRLGVGGEILGRIKRDPRRRKLLPPSDARVLIDRHYIMAAAGVLSQRYPQEARLLLGDSLGASLPQAFQEIQDAS
jgi:uncharacterized protein (TIGR01319 family)